MKVHSSDQVLLVVPNVACKLLVKWRGPYSVLEMFGPLNYHLQQPGKWTDTKLYHINLLKKMVAPWALCV